MGDYEAIIGMEVHAQLLTKSKMFCGCDADYIYEEPNTHTCPVCTGMPGVLPVINRKAVEYAIMTALALNCRITESSVYSRKSYFYPDLPKNYQISMYDLPLSKDGWLEIEAEGQTKRIGITRVHLEEDTAKLFHIEGHSLIDFNRSGVPLMEIVSEPDIRTPEEARQYLIKLRTILRYLDVSTGEMEEGAMRCEVNVSLRPVGSVEFGTKVEVKNLNSFRAVKLALEYEIERQKEILEDGGQVEQVTMGWDEVRNVTVVQRGKEAAHDYRYFPEPDLPPLIISREWVEEIRATLPELPDPRRDRFVDDYNLSRYEATLLTNDRGVADYFEDCVWEGESRAKDIVRAKTISNWMTGELFRLMKLNDVQGDEIIMRPVDFVDLLAVVQRGVINANTGKAVLETMFDTGLKAEFIIEELGLAQISDEEELSRIVEEVIAANPEAVSEYLGGKETVLRFLIGQVMKATRGKANPNLAGQLLKEKLR
jgi:aspartyl-tRNA(Asn)/glutamyl-tRNA(Gln) amidotransferase subunit B